MSQAYQRRCSECSNSLAGRKPSAKTCSQSCRNKRVRRLANENKQGVPATQQLAQAINGEFEDAAHEVIQQQLAPVVREAMTEDVLRSIQQLVALTPTAVQAIAKDMMDEDSTVRQRAYTLALKYTIGHPAVVQAKDTDPNQQIVVNFALPRPDAPTFIEVDGEEVEETRTCDACGTQGPAHQFVGASDRCQVCFDKRAAEVRSQFGE